MIEEIKATRQIFHAKETQIIYQALHLKEVKYNYPLEKVYCEKCLTSKEYSIGVRQEIK